MQLVRSSFLSSGVSLKKKLGVEWLGVTIGNFDGMHLGHQSLFDSLDEAMPANKNAAAVLLSFTPHPRLYFASLNNKSIVDDPSFFRINSFRERFVIAESFNFSCLFLAAFNRKLAELSAEQFIKKFIVEGLSADLVVVGDDWRFGKGRTGSAALLSQFGQQFNFAVKTVAQKTLAGDRVSTSKVKEALRAGDLLKVESLLDRPYTLVGKVKRGQMRGGKIGFPTANLYPKEKVLPKYGVYAVKVNTPYGDLLGVSNVGIRPTFSGDTPNVETHIFSEKHLDLYDKYITLTFVARIRDEKKFSSVEELSAQIKLDCQRAKELLR